MKISNPFNEKEIYIETSSGDVYLMELSRSHGCISVTIGGKTFGLTTDSAYDIADTLAIMANDIDLKAGGY